MRFERPWPYLLIASGVGAVSVWFHATEILHHIPLWLTCSDVLSFYPLASLGGIPYITLRNEYPVITGVFIQGMAALGGSRAGYYFASGFFLTAAFVLATYFLYRILPAEHRGRLLGFWLLSPSMPVFLVCNWDIIAVLFVTAAFYAMHQRRDTVAAYFLAFGFSSKFYPVLYLIPLLMRHREPKMWLRLLATFLGAALLLNGYFMVYGFQGWAYFYSFNRERPPNYDSIWGLVQTYLAPGLSVTAINAASTVLFAVSYAFVLRRFRSAETLRLCFAATLLFLGFNKVFSPQYILWLMPFLVLVPPPGSRWFPLLEVANLIVLFSHFCWLFISHDPGFVAVNARFVAIRHALLAAYIVAVLVKLAVRPTTPVPPTALQPSAA